MSNVHPSLRPNPAKQRAWQRRSKGLNRGKGPKRKRRIKSVSNERRAENRERRKVMRDHFGERPPCALCAPLAEHGVVTGCDGWADDADEILRRSAGGSITDVANVRPVGRGCHRFATTHPREMRAWGLELSRYRGEAS